MYTYVWGTAMMQEAAVCGVWWRWGGYGVHRYTLTYSGFNDAPCIVLSLALIENRPAEHLHEDNIEKALTPQINPKK
jgi:hypothetical protein